MGKLPTQEVVRLCGHTEEVCLPGPKHRPLHENEIQIAAKYFCERCTVALHARQRAASKFAR